MIYYTLCLYLHTVPATPQWNTFQRQLTGGWELTSSMFDATLKRLNHCAATMCSVALLTFKSHTQWRYCLPNETEGFTFALLRGMCTALSICISLFRWVVGEHQICPSTTWFYCPLATHLNKPKSLKIRTEIGPETVNRDTSDPLLWAVPHGGVNPVLELNENNLTAFMHTQSRGHFVHSGKHNFIIHKEPLTSEAHHV